MSSFFLYFCKKNFFFILCIFLKKFLIKKLLGKDIIDVDVPTEFEARTFHNSFGKFTWLFLQPIFYAFRPLIIYPKVLIFLY